jgi:hypothetical protein
MFARAWEIASTFFDTFNENLSEYEPTTVIAGTIAVTLFLQQTYQCYQYWDTKQIKRNLVDKSVQFLIQVPIIGSKVKAEIDKEVMTILASVKKEVDEQRAEWKAIETLSEEGLSDEQILEPV